MLFDRPAGWRERAGAVPDHTKQDDQICGYAVMYPLELKFRVDRMRQTARRNTGCQSFPCGFTRSRQMKCPRCEGGLGSSG
jgi:hypothetical protein